MSAIVSTRYGRLEGEEQDGLYVFKGVPFAAAPERSGDGFLPRNRSRGPAFAMRGGLARLLLKTRSPTRRSRR